MMLHQQKLPSLTEEIWSGQKCLNKLKNISVKWKAKGTTVWATEMLSGWKKVSPSREQCFHASRAKFRRNSVRSKNV